MSVQDGKMGGDNGGRRTGQFVLSAELTGDRDGEPCASESDDLRRT